MADVTTEDDKVLIREFLAQHVHGVEVDDDEDLFASGLVNSLFAVQLVMWVERTYGLAVAGEDLAFTNFRSITAISEFVERKKALAGGGA
ncbi:phosphopantetheine-binding protein [Streptomyces sp. NPDC048518]|uniref:phosphopantetheine-binding protein n=1 Tax=Streptomyces sp. NPDC048518 TaxID=3155029 RepID=UPI00340ECC2C